MNSELLMNNVLIELGPGNNSVSKKAVTLLRLQSIDNDQHNISEPSN